MLLDSRYLITVFYLESFLLVFAISGLLFFAIEPIRKPDTTENFQKFISSTFLNNLCVHGKTLKVLLKVIKEHLLLKVIETYC